MGQKRVARSLPGSGYMVQLDGLRAIAVSLVLIQHFYEQLPRQLGLELGAGGVRLFFVLSGFLITGILLQTRSAIDRSEVSKGFAIRQFYIRRALRIFPAYYFIIFAALIAGNPDVKAEFWWCVTYTINFLFASREYFGKTTAHLWSLSVEEQFYVFWPLIILFVPRRTIIVVILAVIVAALAYRQIGAYLGFGLSIHISTMASLDGLAFGALLAWIDDRNLYRLREWITRFGIAALLLIPFFGVVPVGLQYTIFSVSLFGIVALASSGFGGGVGKALSAPYVVYLGKISYGIYLYHLFVPWFVHDLLGVPVIETPAIEALFMAAVTISAAALSWAFLEQPINRAKRRFPMVPARN